MAGPGAELHSHPAIRVQEKPPRPPALGPLFQKNSIFHPSFFPYKVFIKKFVFLNFLLAFVTNPNSHPTSPAWDIYYPINTVRCIVYVAFSDGFLT